MPKAVSLFLIRDDTQFAARNVRYWHLADIPVTAHVRFRGKADIASASQKCPLMTQGGPSIAARKRAPKDSVLGPLT